MTRHAPSRRRLAAALLCGCLALTACGGSDEPPGPTPTGEPATWALTGRLVPAGTAPGPVLVVKVDSTPAAAPQVGLDDADVVVEELVEGGLTRLAVMLHSALPSSVAPVRSVRTTDIGVVAPTGGVLVASGGAGAVLDAVQGAGITLWTLGDDGLSRDPVRRAPHDVVLDPAAALAALAAEPDPPGPPAQDLFDFGDLPGDATATPAPTSVTLSFSAGTSVRWSWTADGGWVRSGDLAEPAFVPDTLLVLRVEVEDAGYRDAAGAPVPETVTEGSGAGLMLHDGRAVDVTWHKAEPADPWTFTTADGADAPVPPGRTYLALVPTSGDVGLA